MNSVIIHLADLHYRLGWVEDHGIVLDMFFKDLSQQINQVDGTNLYLAFSGDFVQSGKDSELFNDLFLHFNDKLNSLNIPKSRRICVPGNHDVSIENISEKIVEHEGVVSQGLNEHQFNDYILRQPNVLTDKFSQYKTFENRFAEFGVLGTTVTGAGWEIADDIGVYCLNTALCSSGGVEGRDGKKILDKRRLAIDTRSLNLWNLNSKARRKIP